MKMMEERARVAHEPGGLFHWGAHLVAVGHLGSQLALIRRDDLNSRDIGEMLDCFLLP